MKTRTEKFNPLKLLVLGFLIITLPILTNGQNSLITSNIGNTSKALSSIPLINPTNNYYFNLADSKTFRWNTPSPAITGDRRYILKIVKVDNGQTAEQAIANNVDWFLDTTEIIATNSGYEKTISDLIPSYSKMAWQVKAIDVNKVLIASSSIYTFYGPVLIGAFYAGDHTVYVTNSESTSLSDLTGEGEVQITYAGAKQKVYFEHIKVDRVGALLIMTQGVVKAKYQGNIISLSSNYLNSGNATFTPDSLLIDQQYMRLKGQVKWQFTNPSLSNNIIVLSKPTWIIYDDYYLFGRTYLDSLNYRLADPYHFRFGLSTKSYFILSSNNSFRASFDGIVTSLFDNANSQKDSITMAFNSVNNLEYFPLDSIKGQRPLMLNEVVNIFPEKAILDLSTQQSPNRISDITWKGICFSDFNIRFNNKGIDHIVKLKSGNKIAVKTPASTNSKLLIASNGLDLSVDTSFTTNLGAYYNGFDGSLKKIKINRPLASQSADKIIGTISIPYIQNMNLTEYSLNFKGSSCVDSLRNRIEDFSFYPIIDKKILNFSVLNGTAKIPATIDQSLKTITFTLPQGANVKKTICYFSTSGNKVTVNYTNQIRGVTENDFTNAQIFTVTAGDGSQENYRVYETKQTSISDISTLKINIYPNPVSDILYIENCYGVVEASIYTIEGKLISKLLFQGNRKDINVRELPVGLYLLVVKTDKGLAQTKFAKQ